MRYIRQLLWVSLAMAVMVAIVARTRREAAEAALPYFGLVTFLVAAWVVYDAHRIRLRQYQTSLAWHPALVFILVALSPVIVFPWYLTVRERVLRGQVPERPPAREPR